MTDKYNPPRPAPGDVIHTTIRATLGAIPYVGSAATEFFNAVIAPPILKRREIWMEEIAKALNQLESTIEGFKVEELSKNEEFISAIMHGTIIAMRTHQTEKIEILRDAVINVAIGRAPRDDLQLMFLRFIDELTPYHLKILKLFSNPAPYVGNIGMGGLSTAIEKAVPELQNQKEFYTLLYRDLGARGLLIDSGLNVTMTGHGLGQKRTTQLGDAFLEFIKSPT